MRNLLVLWDVDFTLIRAGGIGKHLYELAFHDLFGRDMPAIAAVDGRTERAIIADTLAGAGVCEPQRHVDDFLGRMAAHAPALADLAKERVEVLPGAAAALIALAARVRASLEAPAQTVVASTVAGPLEQEPAFSPEQFPHSQHQSAALAVQSVLTGNARALAELKVRAAGLASYLDLDVGAFGDQHEARSELVHIARRNAFRGYGRAFPGQETVLIGDTPLDVAAALATGARAVGVATGRSTIGELTAAGAHAVLPDLADTAGAVSAILGQC